MIKGFYTAASAMVAGLHRQNILAQNIANLDTPGFRQILMTADDWYVTPINQSKNDIKPNIGSNKTQQLGYLGLGMESSPEMIDFTQGAVKATESQMDFAIQGSGFFRIQTPNGERYTRNGSFQRDANNQLVNVDGFFVLDNNGQTITLPEGQPSIDEAGSITVNGQQVATLGLAAFTDPKTELVRDGLNNFNAAGGITGTDSGKVQQGYLEMSNSNLVSLMTQLNGSKAYEANQRIVQMQDEMLGKTISTLNRL